MSSNEGVLGNCRDCGTTVEVGVEVTVQIEEGRDTIVLCEDCAVVTCTSCGSLLELGAVFDKGRRRSASTHFIECSRCGETVPTDNAVELRNDRDMQYRKRICGDCLKEIAVPPGYSIVRDFAPDE